MRSLFYLPLILVLGCATTRQFEERVKVWEGQNVTDLTKAWGPANSEIKLADGGTMVIYQKRNDERLKIRNPENPREVAELIDCKTTFVANASKRIVSWKYEGHGCRE